MAPVEKNNKEKKDRKQLERGASDDWEAIKLILDGLPSLKQRVLHKLRALKNKEDEQTVFSKKEQKDYKREKQREKKK